MRYTTPTEHQSREWKEKIRKEKERKGRERQGKSRKVEKQGKDNSHAEWTHLPSFLLSSPPYLPSSPLHFLTHSSSYFEREKEERDKKKKEARTHAFLAKTSKLHHFKTTTQILSSFSSILSSLPFSFYHGKIFDLIKKIFSRVPKLKVVKYQAITNLKKASRTIFH